MLDYIAKLFHRTQNGLRLTSHGEHLLPYATKILKLADQALISLAAPHAEQRPDRIVIGADETITT
jgi:DNA-binding transcriptional LysR family regulator